MYENYHRVKITDDVISEIVNLSDKYIYDRKFPDKAIDVMDEVCSRTSVSVYKKNNAYDLAIKLSEVKDLKNKSIINNKFDEAFLYKKTEMILEDKKNKMEFKNANKTFKKIKISDVFIVISEMSKIPLYKNKSFAFDKFINSVSKIVFGQDKAISMVGNYLKKSSYLSKNNKPVSFLFFGPTGVGKTLLAKEYGKYFYGDNIIRIDMSEYREGHSISKMIGSPPGYAGYNDNKNVFEQVKDNPYSLIILDEIEKASCEVINLFLQILDEGIVTNSKGDKINFSNCTIIMTSNLGFNKNSIGFGETSNFESINEFFGIEFVNRIGKLIRFNRIDLDICKKLVESKLNKLKKYYKKRGFLCSFSNNLVVEITDLCEYDKYGARKIDDTICSVQEVIASKILSGFDKIRIESLSEAKVV